MNGSQQNTGPFVPRVYGASELGVLSLTAPGPAHPRVQHLGGDLFVGLDEAGAALTQGTAETLSLPFAEVVAAALAPSTALPEIVDGVLVIRDEVLSASVLVQPERLGAVAVSGDLVVFPLSREAIAIVGTDDEPGFRRILDLADVLHDGGGQLVSAHQLVLVDGQWAPFQWMGRFPDLDLRLRRMVRMFGVRAYERQGVALQRPDVHIAAPKLVMSDDGVAFTIATWPKGTATLLPVVDNVMVADPSGTISVATMTEFLDAAGDAVVRTGLSPLRYFVPGAPPRSNPA